MPCMTFVSWLRVKDLPDFSSPAMGQRQAGTAFSPSVWRRRGILKHNDLFPDLGKPSSTIGRWQR